jgi:ethanolamine utilization microcompartment shell protein EutS
LSEERKLALFAPKKVTTETVKIQIGFIRKYSASIVLSGP